jgi:hypothetical protein
MEMEREFNKLLAQEITRRYSIDGPESRLFIEAAIWGFRLFEKSVLGVVFFEPATLLPSNNGDGYSDDVLIDLNGLRKHFAIGWYDYDQKKWYFHQEDNSYFKPADMTWTYLPIDK